MSCQVKDVSTKTGNDIETYIKRQLKQQIEIS